MRDYYKVNGTRQSIVHSRYLHAQDKGMLPVNGWMYSARFPEIENNLNNTLNLTVQFDI